MAEEERESEGRVERMERESDAIFLRREKERDGDGNGAKREA